MTATKKQKLSGWGRTPVKQCLTFRPEKRRDIVSMIDTAGTLIARGMGRSYGDASLQPAGTALTSRLNHFIHFDEVNGVITAQAGVTLAEVIDLSAPKGWFPYNVPGTRFVTLGGAFACNVHGKNQFKDGDFAEHVLSVQLVLADGRTVECSPQMNPELFWSTAGGMGMTGIIEQVTLQLKRIDSVSLSATTYRVETLDDMVAAFENYRENSDYMVGWIDHMARGEDLGRGIFEAATHTLVADGGTPAQDYKAAKPRLTVPFFMPSFLLNRYTMALYNHRRFKKYSTWRQAEIVDFDTFFHPLDRLRHWNRLYGKRGFFQYQALFPANGDVVQRMHKFLHAIQKEKMFSFLAVIKYHRAGKGPIPFSQNGYSIALDFPNTRRVRRILPQLDRWLAEQGGRIYLAKDATLSAEHFYAMYGQDAADWTDLIRHFDPTSKFTSLMSQRLGWKEAP